MNNKRLKIAAAVLIVLMITAAVFVFIHLSSQKVQDRQVIDELSSVALTIPDGFTITAANGSMNTQKNSSLSARAGLRSGANIFSTDISFRPDGVPVLAERFSRADDKSVTLARIFEYMKEHEEVSVFLNLREVTNVRGVEDLVKEFGYVRRAVYTGVNKHHAAYLQKTSPEIPFYLDIAPEAIADTEHAMAYHEALCETAMTFSAVGIRCDIRLATKALVDTARGYGLRVSVYNTDKDVDMYRALSMGVDNIETLHPDVLMRIINEWSRTSSVDDLQDTNNEF